MICISIINTSNRLAVVDMFNAAPQCDLLELRLDRLEHPDLTLLLETRQKPVLVSCRRRQDGGEWDGEEEKRLILLRQAIVDGADYVELEMDVAGQVPRYGKTKRVVSYTLIDRPVIDLEALYRRAKSLNADVVKLTGLTRTLEDAWPMLRILAKREIPTVAVGLGAPGLTVSILGRKLGSPWVYAALEKGMEAHPGQVTARELREGYRYDAIEPNTPLVGVAGFGPRETLTLQVLNTAFAQAGLKQLCLPMELGEPANFERMMEALHVGSAVLDVASRSGLLGALAKVEETAQLSQEADLLLKRADGWHGYNTVWRSAVRALEGVVRGALLPSGPAEEGGAGESLPLQGRSVLLAGATATARAIAYGLQRRGAILIVTSHDEDRAMLLAQMFQCRYVPAGRIYATYADVLILPEEESEQPGERAPAGTKRPLVEAGYLRENLIVMDLRNIPYDTPLLGEARLRRCKVVEPMDVFAEQLHQQLRGLTGKDVPTELVRSWIPQA